MHHLMGSLLPPNNKRPKFVQLYIYDTKNEINNRMSSFVFDDASKDLTKLITELLLEMLDKTNKVVKIFCMVKDKFNIFEILSMGLRLIGWRPTNNNQYELPTSTDIGALIVGDIREHESVRDIVIENRTKALQRITRLHPSPICLDNLMYYFLTEKIVTESIYGILQTPSIKKHHQIEFLCGHFIAINYNNVIVKEILYLKVVGCWCLCHCRRRQIGIYSKKSK